jgi:hypothetical protein
MYICIYVYVVVEFMHFICMHIYMCVHLSIDVRTCISLYFETVFGLRV